MSPPQRERAREAFLNAALGRTWEVAGGSADASFRQYFRVIAGRDRYMLMDAPPDREDCRPFVAVADRLRQAGLRAPEVHHADLSRGFLLLDDFGDVHYRERIQAHQPQPWLERALDTAERLARAVSTEDLPDYDEHRLGAELDLFTDWFLDGQLGAPLDADEAREFERIRRHLIESAMNQPQVFVHRDFHSSNLMDVDGGPPGVIDFQDAVRGPLAYDLVSLLLDRYITWPRAQLLDWYEAFRARVAPDTDPARWLRDCDLMGLQRNLKVVGIFARLNARDGKAGYLDLQPRFLGYLWDALDRYPEFGALSAILERRRCGR